MEVEYEKKYHQLETEHFWFKSRRRFILQQLKHVDRNSKILDIGCSSGVLLKMLIEMGFGKESVYGIDISEKAISLCKSDGLKNVYVMDAQQIEFDAKFDIIIASDCLEHVENDKRALLKWSELLETDGTGYIFVPAFMSLWSKHDVANMHYRRYTKSNLSVKLKSSGFVVQRLSYWNFFLFVPVFLYRSLGRVFNLDKSQSDIESVPKMNILLCKLLGFENRLLNFMDFPFGISVFAIVQRK